MGTFAIAIHVAPVGELELSGDGSSPTQQQMDEEQGAQDNLVKTLVPFLQSLPKRPKSRVGNVTGFDLLGGSTWSRLNDYLLLLQVDLGPGPGVVEDLTKALPEGSEVSVLSDVYKPLASSDSSHS